MSPPLSSRAPEGASVHGGAVSEFLKSVARPRGEALACPQLRARTALRGGPSGFRRPTLSQAWSGIGNPRTAMCVRNVDVHVSCSSHVDAQFAAFFIDPRAE